METEKTVYLTVKKVGANIVDSDEDYNWTDEYDLWKFDSLARCIQYIQENAVEEDFEIRDHVTEPEEYSYPDGYES